MPRLTTQQSVNAVIKSICDIMRRSNCAGALQYVPELTWILFLRILDERETREAEEAEAVGAEYTRSLEAPYRWQDWAAPGGPKRTELQNGSLGAFFGFVNGDLIPRLKSLREKPNAAPRQKVISEIFSGVERTRIDTERNLLDVLDKGHEISAESVDPTHVFTLSQVYEGLLLKMGEKGNDGGQFFTPREIIRVMVNVLIRRSARPSTTRGAGREASSPRPLSTWLGRTMPTSRRPTSWRPSRHRPFTDARKTTPFTPSPWLTWCSTT